MFSFSNEALSLNLDSHVHLSSVNHEKNLEFLSDSKKKGFDKLFVLSSSYAAKVKNLVDSSYTDIKDRKFIKQENDYISKLQKEHPDTVLGFCSVPWNYKRAKKEITRCAKSLNLKGLKVYPAEFYLSTQSDGLGLRNRIANFSDKKDYKFLNLLVDLAIKYKMIIGIHSSNLSVNDLSSLLIYTGLRDSTLPIILYHGVSFQDFHALNFISHFNRKNLFIEMSYAFREYPEGNPLRQMWIKMLREIGVKKILFGSDTSIADAYTPSGYDSQKIHLKEYQKIFSPQEMKTILSGHTKTLIEYNK